MLSLALMVVDHRQDYLNNTRSFVSLVTAPLLWIANIPANLLDAADDALQTREQLIEHNLQLDAQNIVLRRSLQKMAALSADNTRLRELLNSAAVMDEKVLVVELVGEDPDPFRHRVTIDKGSLDDIFVGQAVLDAEGLLGQVTRVSPFSAEVLLIADRSHSLPVQVNRNGVRAIASGTGALDEIILRHVPNTSDVREGDLLVSSGLGGRFPVGYPVATVMSVEHNPGRPFAIVKARPSAKLNRTRRLLVVFPEVDLNEVKVK